MHAQPGVYAVLLGSGVSTGAQVPTGWGIVRELVRRVAAATHPDDPAAGDRAATDPERWWSENGTGELGYSSLLEQLAPTPATRQALLAEFFEPTEADREDGIKVPSPAHHALAQLVKRGTVRVILTTNFDRLTEQALDAAGVAAQVIARPEAVGGMAPLAHAKATVVKLHGDYLDLGTRNTPTELRQYPAEWTGLLGQILDEYGLLISGWSADWDAALVDALERAPARRYPLYWDSRSSRGSNAARLLEIRAGHVVPADSADELFRDLSERIAALERLSEPPLTTAMALARLKKYLPDPVRRVDLYDLVMDQTDLLESHLAEQPPDRQALPLDELDQLYRAHLRAAMPLLRLLVSGVWHDDGAHVGLWREVLQRLVDARTGMNSVTANAKHLPALLALMAMGAVSVRRDHGQLLHELLLNVSWHTQEFDQAPPAAQALHVNKVFPSGIEGLPRWTDGKPHFAGSRLVRTDLRVLLSEYLRTDREYRDVFDDVEYYVGLAQQYTQDAPVAYRAAPGEFILRGRWTDEGGPRAERSFRHAAVTHGPEWVWWQLGVDDGDIGTGLERYRDVLRVYRDQYL